MKHTRQIAVLCIAGALLTGVQVNIANAQTEVSLRTVNVMQPDTLNNLDGMVTRTDTFQIVTTIKSVPSLSLATLGFMLYSPDNSIENYSLLNVAMTSGWINSWFPPLVSLATDFDGSLPEQFFTGADAIFGTEYHFQSDTFIDMLVIDIAIPTAGIICLDSALFPTAPEWLMIVDSASGAERPPWLAGGGDLTVGGSRPSAFCITITPGGCCQVPGDADHSGSANIADVTFMLARIFSGGPAPVCINEADANGHGGFNITDVAFMTKWIFRGGFPPICPANSN